ncbi:MAG: polysaccharide deacetylase family protein [Acidobacteriota bacterium]
MTGAVAGGIVAGAALAAGGGAYAAMWPASQLFGRTLIAPARPGEIALTFDDGPNPACTPRLLELLDRHNVKAAFFLVGKYASQEPGLTRRIADAGHTVGNHTWSHPNLALTAPRRVREELRKTNDALEQITGKPVRFFRPPFGARRPDVLHGARELGMIPVLWNAMTNDWAEPSAERIAAALGGKIESAKQRGRAANVVLHDGGHLQLGTNREPSVKAAGLLLERFSKSQRFVTVDEWQG